MICINILFFYFKQFMFFMLGVQGGGCGEAAVRLRPALTFDEHHADIFLDKFRQVLKDIK